MRSIETLGEARDLSWFAGEVEELLEKVGVLTTWSWLDVYNQLRHMEEIWDHSDRSVKKPVKVRDLWYQLLNSESVHPHITSFSDFENALRDAYENNEIAFRYGSQLIWLRHPYSMDEAKQYYRSRRGRLNDWVSDVKTRLDRLHIKLEDLEIIHPDTSYTSISTTYRGKTSQAWRENC